MLHCLLTQDASGYSSVLVCVCVCMCVFVTVLDYCPGLLTSTLCTLFFTHMGLAEHIQFRQTYQNGFSK